MTLDEMIRTEGCDSWIGRGHLPAALLFSSGERRCVSDPSALLLPEVSGSGVEADSGIGFPGAAHRICAYDEIQMRGHRDSAVSGKVMVLTGGPGTGKTTTTLGIISAYREAGCEGASGGAHRQGGQTALRGHRHGGEDHSPAAGVSSRRKGIRKTKSIRLEGDVLILDECSMIDVMLMYNLLKAVPDAHDTDSGGRCGSAAQRGRGKCAGGSSWTPVSGSRPFG